MEAKLTKDTFTPISYPKTDPNQNLTYNKVVLCFSKEVACRVYDEFTGDQIRIDNNGDLIVSTNMPIDSWVVGYLLSFGDKVEVIEPLYIKETLKKESYKTYIKNKS